ncbi:MAG: alpha/beta hydrolase [Leptolyngbyaceae cyanobacterium]
MTRFGKLILNFIGILSASWVSIAPANAAESVVFRYGLLELPLPVVDLHYYAQTHQVRPAIRGLFQFISKTDQQSLYELLPQMGLNAIARFFKLFLTDRSR